MGQTVIDWLLDADPAIRWQVLRDLTDASPEEVSTERRRIATEGWGAQLLALQADDGRWGGRLVATRGECACRDDDGGDCRDSVESGHVTPPHDALQWMAARPLVAARLVGSARLGRRERDRENWMRWDAPVPKAHGYAAGVSRALDDPFLAPG